MKYKVLILGASYGSLLGTKLLMAGHRVTLVCTQPTAELINREGTRVRFPVRGRTAPLEVASNGLPGVLSASAPDAADPDQYDLVVLGMQEPQYGSRGVRQLMGRIARARKPCLAIMNMPPLPYLKRIPGLATEPLEVCYTDPRVWDGFDPGLTTLASPDPQAFRPPEEPKNVLEVGLPTNFKAARFDAAEPTALLRRLEADIEEAWFDLMSGVKMPDSAHPSPPAPLPQCGRREIRGANDRQPFAQGSMGGVEIQIPVKLKVHDSTFVPLAKWPMLMTGNYRCIRPHEMIPIRDAVHGNIGQSRKVYDWVSQLCTRLGAESADLVPFEKYAKAAEDLRKPSAAARALLGGAMHIERVDRLIQRIARQLGLQFDPLHEMVTLIDERLEKNRIAAGRQAFASLASPVGVESAACRGA